MPLIQVESPEQHQMQVLSYSNGDNTVVVVFDDDDDDDEDD